MRLAGAGLVTISSVEEILVQVTRQSKQIALHYSIWIYTYEATAPAAWFHSTAGTL